MVGAAPRRTGRLLLGAALVLAAWSMAPALEPGPWRHSWLGHNGARYAQIARNYLRDGLLAQRGAPRLDPAGDVSQPDVYAHHPPGVSMVVALVFAVTGVGETPARLVPAVSTLLALVLLALIAGRVAGPRTGGVAALLCAAMPMTGVYGAHLDVQGAPVLAASLGVVWAYVRWRNGAPRWPLVALAVLASGFDWYGLYAPGLCALHLLFTDRGRRPLALLLGGLTLLLFGLWFSWLVTLPGMSLERFFDAAGVRGPSALAQAGDGQGLDQARTWWLHSVRLMPAWPVLLLVAAAVAAGRLAPTSSGAVGPRGLMLLLVVPPVIHGLAFPAGMLVHSYWLFGLPAGLAAALALALQRWHLGIALAAALALFAAGPGASTAGLPDAPDEVPAQLGTWLAEHTEVGDVILATYDTNPLVSGARGDIHVTRRPEVTYYADRTVRGLPRTSTAGPTVADLEEALRRRPDARWLLIGPWPSPSTELLEAVAARAVGEGLLLHAEPPVRLVRLAP